MDQLYSRRELLKKIGVLTAAGITLGPIASFQKASAASAGIGTIYNVKDYGAKGTRYGNHNDTTAFQNAINDIVIKGGGTLYVPPGEYIFHQPIAIHSNVSLIGSPDKKTIIRHNYPHQTSILIDSAENISIQNITFQGHGSVRGDKLSSYERAIFIKNSRNVLIHDCLCTFLAAAFEIEDSKQVNITNCHISDTMGSKQSNEGRSIAIKKSNDITISSNRFERGFREFVHMSGATKAVQIINNNFYTEKNGAITIAGDEVCSGIEIIMNNINQVQESIKKDALSEIFLSGAVSNSKISDNTITNSSTAGIIIDGTPVGKSMTKVNGNLIAMNWIRYTNQPIICKNTSNNTIANNYIDGANEYGIVIDAVGDKSVSNENVIVNNIISKSKTSAIFIANRQCKATLIHSNAGIGNKEKLIDKGVDTKQE